MTARTNAGIDQNDVKSLLAVSSADGESIVVVWADPVTHALLVKSVGGGGGTFVDNEIVSGSGTSWTLANTPVTGTQHIYANGQRLTPGVSNDYVIVGNVITTDNSYAAGSVLADYQM